jgi:NAD-dependent deacetylase
MSMNLANNVRDAKYGKETTLNIVILTGAGISAESGLGTFRDQDGLWSRFNLEDVATPQAFARNPGLVHEFYNMRRANCRKAQPNSAHLALAELEALHTGKVLIVTQNVDDLHQRAGSRNVLQMHGELDKARCVYCSSTWPAPDVMTAQGRCPSCWAKGCRPDVVWFGEPVRFFSEIEEAIRNADLFAMIGSSGQVSPASEFMKLAHDSGANTVELNLEPSAVASRAGSVILGPATEAVPRWVSTLL